MEQKKFIKMGLTSDNFRIYVEQIIDEVTTFLADDPSFRTFQLDDARKWGTFHVINVISKITLLTACRTLQGKEIRAAMDTSFPQLYADLNGGLTPMNMFLPNLPTPANRRRDRAHKDMTELYLNIIHRRASGEGSEVSLSLLASQVT